MERRDRHGDAVGLRFGRCRSSLLRRDSPAIHDIGSEDVAVAPVRARLNAELGDLSAELDRTNAGLGLTGTRRAP
ncbi:hypothetical protein BAY61_08450 [Prauserella marina]|uniref:hypothetical protein n=1 Tax=Prauserella marina TaxID=530584 RepID=UPI000B803B2C|nr:hypothetical protein [Prauserella marina]ASR35006.1 hypothetical protein BAY61_08450 [Prauserella marina]